MVDKKSIESDTNSVKTNVIGTFEGECADSNITNLNGLDITRPVWESVFASEEYKQGIDNGWYIGFLGHPDDPNCMNFQDACIVMTEGHIDNDGKIYGKFNLIDTPVGRIVKSFQDAGVKFGISVRGAGDIIDNSVDPETFVFRGFDLVSFPAYPDSIPTFTEIAASSDVEKRKKYKAISAAVKKNIDEITSCEVIDVIQPYFAEQSEEYQILEDRKCELNDEEDVEAEKLEGVLDLYLAELKENNLLRGNIEDQKNEIMMIESAYKRKIKSLDRITSSQISELDNELTRIQSSLSLERKTSSQRIKKLEDQIYASSQSNLKYKRTINATRKDVASRDVIISNLRDKLNETVRQVEAGRKTSSNLDGEISELKAALEASRELIKKYQDAYAYIYANAIGVQLNNVRVTASTSPEDLKKMIEGSTNIDETIYAEPTPADIVDDDDGLVTL